MGKTRRMNVSDNAEAPESDPLCGHVLAGRYRLHERLGAGGFGAVYAAGDLANGAVDCVVKVALTTGPEAVEAGVRLFREAEILRRTASPGVVRYIDHGESDGLRFLVMERLRGQDLAAVVRAGRLTGPGAIDRIGLLAGCFRAVADLHDHHVAHGDLKPNNVFLTVAGEVKLVDFGAATLLASHETLPPGADDLFKVTQPGIVLASPGYTAPERFQGATALCDPRAADIFSLGAIAYLLVMGRPAVPGEGRGAVLWTMEHDIKVPRDGATSAQMRAATFERLAALIEGATRRNPVQRTPSARHLLDELTRARQAMGTARRAPSGVEPGPCPPGDDALHGRGARFVRASSRPAFVFALAGAVGLWTGFAWSRSSDSEFTVAGPEPTEAVTPPADPPPAERPPAEAPPAERPPADPPPRQVASGASPSEAPPAPQSNTHRPRAIRPRPRNQWLTYEPGLFPSAPNPEEP